MSLTQANIMAVNLYAFKVMFSKPLRPCLGEDLYIILLLVWSKKTSTVVNWWKKNFNKKIFND